MTDLAHPVLLHYCIHLPRRHRLITKTDGSALYFYTLSCDRGGTVVAQWLRCCATNRKVAGSIPEGVIGIFH